MSGIGIAVLDILFDSSVENMVLLQHQAYMLAQPMCIPVLQFYAIKFDAATIGMVELV